MSWNDRPQHGERWRYIPKRRDGSDRQETRTVRDRCLGGDVVYTVTGGGERRCTEVEWLRWQATARQLP